MPLELFAGALEASARKAFAGKTPSPQEIERFLESLHLEDLAIACACAAGHEAAWEHFVREHRPVLYRSADAIDSTGGARELADSLYAELFGVTERGGERQSLFRYFHGRSSLATWLRALLAQRLVDRVRATSRLAALPGDDSSRAIAASLRPPEPSRRRHAELLEQALGQVLSRLSARDRLRLGCYYAQEMTLAQIGRLLGEHEATVSRHLASTRRAMRGDIEQCLREGGLNNSQIAECLESAVADSGSIDLRELLGTSAERKEAAPARSK